MPRREALLQAADRRFRPIAMTALTTIIGMIPLTVQPASDIGLIYKSFGLTLIGGMTAATLLTLLLVPVFYTLFDDAREAVVRRQRPGDDRRRAFRFRISDFGLRTSDFGFPVPLRLDDVHRQRFPGAFPLHQRGPGGPRA